jgi:hypothetical protein
MQKPRTVWTLFLVFGALLWLTNVGVGTHPVYRLALMLAVFSWCGYVVRTPKSA